MQLIPNLFFLVTLLASTSCAKLTAVPPPFDLNLANSTLYLAVAVLCDQATFASRDYIGPSAGFQHKATLYDAKTDTVGMVGLLDKQIFVLFRGTTSWNNWVSDAEAWQDDPHYEGCADCAIHHGFHRCMDAIRDQLFASVSTLRKSYPSYPIVVGGHSLGGAIATLAAVDIVASGVPSLHVRHYTFGSPRVGNKAFAQYADALLPTTQRITHYKDPVPHAPPQYIPMVGAYEHLLSEVYESEEHSLKACKGVSDPTCMMQWRDTQTDASDHSLYLDLCTSCSCV